MLSSRQNLVILFERGGPKLEIVFLLSPSNISHSPHLISNSSYVYMIMRCVCVCVCVNVLYEDYLCAWNISGAFEDSARGNIP